MKNKINGVAGLATLCVLFCGLALALVSCTGSYTPPDMRGGDSEYGGYYDDDDDDSGPSGGSKPSKLSSSATYNQAIAKLDEIIAYSGTSSSVKVSAQQLKTAVSTAGSSYWSSYSAQTILSINTLIDLI
jgi:hypothetical protein